MHLCSCCIEKQFLVFWWDMVKFRHGFNGIGRINRKGHPTMKILSPFTHSLVPSLYEFLLLNTKDNIMFEECWKQDRWSPLTSILVKHIMEVSGQVSVFFKVSSIWV